MTAAVTNQQNIVVLLRWGLLAVAAVVGAVLSAVLADDAVKAVISYLAGMAIALLLFELSAFNIRFTAQNMPKYTMAAALFSYTMSAIALAVLLAVSSPTVVSGVAIASGLICAAVIWVATEVARVRVRSEAH